MFLGKSIPKKCGKPYQYSASNKQGLKTIRNSERVSSITDMVTSPLLNWLVQRFTNDTPVTQSFTLNKQQLLTSFTNNSPVCSESFWI